MAGMSKAMIIGNLGRDPEMKYTANGRAVTTFSVATNRVWSGKNGRQEETEFHNIVAWGRQAEIASQFLQKGALVFVEGRLRTRGWQDKQGQNRKTTEIICETLQLGPRPAGAGRPAAGSEPSVPEAQAPAAEDIPIINLEEDIKAEDLPF